MQKKINIKLLPSEAAHRPTLESLVAKACGITTERITGLNILKQSIDAVQNDPRTLERLARERLGYARTNEVIIRFEPRR